MKPLKNCDIVKFKVIKSAYEKSELKYLLKEGYISKNYFNQNELIVYVELISNIGVEFINTERAYGYYNIATFKDGNKVIIELSHPSL